MWRSENKWALKIHSHPHHSPVRISGCKSYGLIIMYGQVIICRCCADRNVICTHNVCFNLLCFNGTNAISQSSVPSMSILLMNEPSTSIDQHLNFAQCATMHAIQQANSVPCEGYYLHGLVHHIVECLYSMVVHMEGIPGLWSQLPQACIEVGVFKGGVGGGE